MHVHEEAIEIPIRSRHEGLLNYFSNFFREYLINDSVPVRFVVSQTDEEKYHCEVGVIGNSSRKIESVFQFNRRKIESTDAFNAVFLIPTGIGAQIGGHAGDATPVARMLSAVCDNLIIHPNAVNASDINEMPDNALYVEGSIITRLLMGTVGLRKVRSNRVLLVIDDHKDDFFTNLAVNSANAACATYGCGIRRVVELNPPVELAASFSQSGRAVGTVKGLENILSAIQEEETDAVAISSVIRVPHNYHMDYFRCEGDMVNPWGGVEAIFTHSLSLLTNLPTAHSPMFESREIANMDPGIVDSRMAAEAVSTTFLQCILKGLQRSPQIVVDQNLFYHPNVLTAENVSCLIIPDGCIGLPTLAALEQGIPVIAVKENGNIMKNDLMTLPWQEGKFIRVNTYMEAVGVMAALQEGISLESLQRPLSNVQVQTKSWQSKEAEKIISK